MNTCVTLPIPTPFPVGPINAYLIKSDPITLIDCGPNTEEAKQYLASQLEKTGLKIEDIERIIITHTHPDHFGLAAYLQRISKAPVYVHNADVIKAQNRYQHLERVNVYLSYAGMPDELCNQLKEYFKWEVSFVEPIEEIIGVEDGHIFSFDGFNLQGVLTPGHSIGHLCLLQKEAGFLFAGDTILDRITPNPVLEPLVEQRFQREKSLQQYIDSLHRLERLDIKCILTGHGNSLTDIAGTFERLKAHYQKRKNDIIKIVANRLEFSPFELTNALYHNLKVPVDYYLALSEIIAHLDLLEEEGKIIRKQSTKGLVYTIENRKGD